MKDKNLLTILCLTVIVLVGFVLYFTISFVFGENRNETNPNSTEMSLYESIGFVNEDTFEKIREIYADIDFIGEFSKGNIELYDFYKKKFLRLLDREATFFDKNTQKNYYIDEFGEMNFTVPGIERSTYWGTTTGSEDTYDPRNYMYYFFDMDGDGTPELVISDESRFLYIIKYDSDSDVFILWHEIFATQRSLLGTRKLSFYSGNSPIDWAFIRLDEQGGEEYSIWFHVSGYTDAQMNEDIWVYLVSLPKFTDESRNVQISDSMKEQAFVFANTRENRLYFRVTEEQWNNLINDFGESRILAEGMIEEVSFTYEELFINTF